MEQAIQVSPVTEADMSSAQSIFQRMADAVVEASKLKPVVDELRASLETLKHEVEQVRSNNRWLDEQLSNVRSQRDQAKEEAEKAKAELHSVQMEVQSLRDSNATQAETINTLRASLEQARRERDDYGLKHMQAEEALKEARQKLDDLKTFAKQFFDEPAKPEPTPEPTPNPTLGPTLETAQPYNPIPWDHNR